MSPRAPQCALAPAEELQGLADRLFAIAGSLNKHRATGGTLTSDEVRLLVGQLDAGGALAERMVRELAELGEMICDLGDAEALAAPWVGAAPSGDRPVADRTVRRRGAGLPDVFARKPGRVARLAPALVVFEGGRRS